MLVYLNSEGVQIWWSFDPLSRWPEHVYLSGALEALPYDPTLVMPHKEDGCLPEEWFARGRNGSEEERAQLSFSVIPQITRPLYSYETETESWASSVWSFNPYTLCAIWKRDCDLCCFSEVECCKEKKTYE